jgi:hypothetical protein
MLVLLEYMVDVIQHDNVVHKVVVLVFFQNENEQQVMDYCYIFVHDMVLLFDLHMVNDNQVIESVDFVVLY